MSFWQERWDENATCAQPHAGLGLVLRCRLAPAVKHGRYVFRYIQHT
jgi:hypothetical protein